MRGGPRPTGRTCAVCHGPMTERPRERCNPRWYNPEYPPSECLGCGGVGVSHMLRAHVRYGWDGRALTDLCVMALCEFAGRLAVQNPDTETELDGEELVGE